MNKFKDVDNVECVLLSDVVAYRPTIELTGILKKTWSAPQGIILAFNDAKIAIKLSNRNLTFDDVDYSQCVCCSVCGEALIPDEDDAYVDVETEAVLCDAHSRFDEDLMGYVKFGN